MNKAGGFHNFLPWYLFKTTNQISPYFFKKSCQEQLYSPLPGQASACLPGKEINPAKKFYILGRLQKTLAIFLN